MWWRKRRFVPELNLAETSIVAIDTETTGFDTTNDRIVSIGVVRIQHGRILLNSAEERYIRLDGTLGSSPTIHGITRDNLDQALTESEAMLWLLDYIGSDTLLAHYAKFDRNMLEALARRTSINIPQSIWLDTMDVEVALHPQKHGVADLLKLDTLLQEYDIEAVRRHTALGDAFSTALLFQKQLARCQRVGIHKASQVKAPRTGLW
ncbi:MAG: hypothetical protein RL754_71 [Bacteroidota bacterium]|jgi:DNA polymerase-3 subunit epsilon